MWVQFVYVAALLVASCVAGATTNTVPNDDESRAQAIIDGLNDELANMRNIQTVASWNFESNITDYNEEVVSNVSIDGAKYTKVSHHLFFPTSDSFCDYTAFNVCL
jgi:hypothetical protein